MIYDISKLTHRFRSKIVVNDDGCWIWKAYKNNGYGRVRINCKNFYTHRVAYEQLVGPIPEGLEIDHFRMNPGPSNAPCRKSCCNPAHLEAVTKSINTQRGRAGHHPNTGSPNRSKTHCKWGHPFDEENTIHYKRWRQCRTCGRDKAKKWRARKKAEAQLKAQALS